MGGMGEIPQSGSLRTCVARNQFDVFASMYRKIEAIDRQVKPDLRFSYELEAFKVVAGRTPFRPFAVRLLNGAKYSFREQREFGAPRDLHVICFFGDNNMVLIDPDQIVEVIDRVE